MFDKNYLFTSARLGFRTWTINDIAPMAALNADPEVMEFFPALKTLDETVNFVETMQGFFNDKGYCYYAVDLKDTGEFIGFTGFFEQTFEADFTPCVDFGWRLKKSSWNNGYATEGARRCLEYAFEELNLEKICSIAPVINRRSENVMRKAGLRKVKHFLHPKLGEYPLLQECVLYEIIKPSNYEK